MTSDKVGRCGNEKDTKSRKKMNLFIAIRCNSFRAVGALLVCTGVMNFYLSSVWVSAVIVCAGASNFLLADATSHLLYYIEDEYMIFACLNDMYGLSLMATPPLML